MRTLHTGIIVLLRFTKLRTLISTILYSIFNLREPMAATADFLCCQLNDLQLITSNC